MTPRSRKLLAPALLLSLLSAAFAFDHDGIRWLWSAQPGIAVALALGAAICWGLMLLQSGKRQAG
ncbi:MAG TPA: hypothetical protein VJN66_02735 [Rhodanobacteraceae bacterium]|nr:hypothetical protein [Rhodanobacteraceae bacterium]